MSLSRALVEGIEDDLEVVSAHPFFRGLAEETLPQEEFSRFLEEDVRFLEVQARNFARLASRCADRRDLFSPLRELSGGMVGALEGHYRPLFGARGLSFDGAFRQACAPVSEAYLRTLMSYIDDGPLLAAVAAELSVLVHHEIVGERLRKRYPALPDSLYGHWVAAWGANPMFLQLIAQVRAAFDRLAEERPADHSAATRSFRMISRFEILYIDTLVAGVAETRGAPFPATLFEGARER